MRYGLFDFQKKASSELIKKMVSMRRSYDDDGSLSAVSLTAPTAAGKTVISAAVAEGLFYGNEEFSGDGSAAILWLSDSPSLNEQTMKKFRNASDMIDSMASMEAIGPEFAKNHRKLMPGHIYFLNRQLLGKGKRLAGEAEGGRSFYDVLNDTIEDSSIHLYLFIDEAHRGIRDKGEDRCTSDAANKTIYSIIIDGSDGVSLPMPCVVGISATPERFNKAMEGRRNRDVKAGVVVTPKDVRESGLIKDIIELRSPKDDEDVREDSDYDLYASCKRLTQAEGEWSAYCAGNSIFPVVVPLMVVQVEDNISIPALSSLCKDIKKYIPHLDTADCFANVFGEHKDIETVDGFNIPYVKPDEVSERTEIRVLFAKDAVSTGWDCPRAEVIYSRRRRSDATYIAQLIGRMVRTPLARRVHDMESLNTVACYLPKYDSKTVDGVVEWLQKDNVPVEDVIRNPESVRFYGDVREKLDQKMADMSRKEENGTGAPDTPTKSPEPHSGTNGGTADITIDMNAPTPVRADNGAAAVESGGTYMAGATDNVTADVHSGGNVTEKNSSRTPVGHATPCDELIDAIDRLPLANPKEIVDSFEGIISQRALRKSDRYIEELFALSSIITSDIDPDSKSANKIKKDFCNNLEGEICRHPAEFTRSLRELQNVNVFVKRIDPLTGDVYEEKTETAVDVNSHSRKWYNEVITKFEGVEGAVKEYIRHRRESEDDTAEEAIARIKAAGNCFEIFEAVEKWAKATTEDLLEEYGPRRDFVSIEHKDKWDFIEGNVAPYIERNLNIKAVTRKQNKDFDRYPKHIVASDEGWAYFRLNDLEKKILRTELAKHSTVAWYRNNSRGNDASLSVAYPINGKWENMYPDFVFFEKTWKGITRSIVDPHGDWLGDSVAKLKGYVQYIKKHPDMFTSVLVVADEKNGELRYLDLKIPAVQAAIEDFMGTSARELFTGQYGKKYHVKE